jgi:uncharacterized SAM-binding protein YcdF (DUF218 family)
LPLNTAEIMFFLLSKLLSLFIKPFTYIIVLLISGWFVRNVQWRQRCWAGALLIALIFSNGLFQNEVLRLWEWPAVPLSELPSAEAIAIVLGGGEDTDREPFDRLFINKAGERMLHGALLYNEGKVNKIIFTGGRAKLFEDSYRENEQIINFFMMCGVHRDDIIMENESRNTRENALYVKNLIEGKSIPSKVVLVTSGFHMRRSLACFQKVGIDATPFSCDFYTSLPADRFSADKLIPSAEVLNNWNFLIKEFIGIMAYRIAGYI